MSLVDDLVRNVECQLYLYGSCVCDLWELTLVGVRACGSWERLKLTFLCDALRSRTIQDARVTAAVWGPFDQYFITGDDVGTLTKYDIVNVRYPQSFGSHKHGALCPM